MTKWLTRHGSEYTGEVLNAKESKGTAAYRYFKNCSRCGGLGGGSQWQHTGWTCFECGGERGHMDVAKLYTAEKLAKLNASQARREATKAIKDKAAAELREAERVQGWTDNWRAFNAEYPGFAEKLKAAAPCDEFLAELYGKLIEYGKLSEKQAAAAQCIMDALQVKDASEYLGEIGERVVLTVTVEKVISWESRYGMQYLHICSDQDGHKVVYKGSSYDFPLTGETAKIKATISGHDEYRGMKQTMISRPKLAEPKAAEPVYASNDTHENSCDCSF